jgi:elongator complex protein 3
MREPLASIAAVSDHPSTTWSRRNAADPAAPTLRAAVEALCALVAAAEAGGEVGPLARADLQRVLRAHPRDGRGFYSRGELIAGFRALPGSAASGVSERAFLDRLKLRPVRTHSGVTPVTVLTKPFPCPGRCVFCPNDVRMPKSYLSREPGCQRAEQNAFDPYLQTWNRMRALRAMGHSVAKIELIVLGGSWSAYPESYQRWFVARCLTAMNDFGRGSDGRDSIERDPEPAVSEASSAGEPLAYNRRLLLAGRGRVAEREHVSKDELRAVLTHNEHAACRNVGLSIETRPDLIDAAEVLRLRALGCTKVQLGLQSLSDDVLAANQRGHDVAQSRRAVELLRSAGFKLQAHWMANLLGSSPARDVADFAQLFADPALRPDELKVYPCSVVPGTELAAIHTRGGFAPYTHDELLYVLTEVLAHTPRYCRLSRVVRDISSEDIVVGNRVANFRELAEAALRARGERVQDIRSREIKHAQLDLADLVLRATEYDTSIGREHFLELCTPDDALVALLRLALPAQPSCSEELGQSALIRELHVYGEALDLGARTDARAQHRGLGRRLIAEAARRASALGYVQLSVISATGTRPYYRRLGFSDGELYQHLAL